MQARTLRTLIGAAGPFASIYFDDSRTTDDGANLAELRRRTILESLAIQGADQALIDRIEEQFAHETPPEGERGRAVIATADGIMVDAILVKPPVLDIVRIDVLPYLLPLVELGDDGAPCVVAFVDKLGADFVVLDASGTEARRESVYERQEPGRKPLDTEFVRDEMLRQNLNDIGTTLRRLNDEFQPELVVLVGDLESRASVASMMSDRALERTVALEGVSRSAGSAGDEVLESARQLLAERRRLYVDGILERFEAEDDSASGRAVRGAQSVGTALGQGKVEILLVEPMTAGIYVGGVPADELLPYRALETGAEIVCPPAQLSEDGFAALLREL